MKKVGTIYRPNFRKIITDYKSAAEMCRGLDISYQNYLSFIKSDKPKTSFKTSKTRDDFFKLINNGYINEISPDEVPNV